MNVPESGFPFRPLDPAEDEHIMALCGGVPINDPDKVHDFLRFSGQQMLRPQPLNFYLSMFNGSSAKALNTRLTPKNTERALNRGALLYAGMYKEVNKVDALPFQPEVIAALGDEEVVDFVITSFQDMEDVPDFENMLNRFEPALARDDDEHQLVQAGGGVLHRIVTASIALEIQTFETRFKLD